MKTYEEMAANVLRRIDEYHADRRRARRRAVQLALPTLCGVCAALVGVGLWPASPPLEGGASTPPSSTVAGNQTQAAGMPSTDTTEAPTTTAKVTATIKEQTPETTANRLTGDADGSAAATPFIVLYQEKAKADSGASLQLMQPDKNYSYNIFLKMVSTKGMTQAQKDAAFDACVAQANRYWMTHSGHYGGHAVHTTADDYVIAVASLNHFRIQMDASKEFKQMRVRTTSPYGAVEVHGSAVMDGRYSVMPQGRDVLVTNEMAQKLGGSLYQEDGILSVAWEPTDESTCLMDGKESLDYAAFNDIIHFEVEYTDGSRSTGSVRLVFDENGEATVFCGEYGLLAE